MELIIDGWVGCGGCVVELDEIGVVSWGGRVSWVMSGLDVLGSVELGWLN